MKFIDLVPSVLASALFAAPQKRDVAVDYHALANERSYVFWDHTPDQILAIANEWIEKEKAMNDQIAAVQKPTLELVFYPYVKFNNEAASALLRIAFYKHVSADEELRSASNKAEELLNESVIEQNLRVDVYQSFSRLNRAIEDGEISGLDPELARYMTKIMSDFKRSGLALDEESRDKVRQILLDLGNLSLQFSKSLNDEKGFLLFTEAELEGVPKDVVESFEKVDGKLRMTYKYPDYHPVMKYATNQNTRKAAYIGFQNTNPENEDVLKQLVEKRFQLAKVLGYDSFADYTLENRLAKDKGTVLSFLDDLKTRLQPIGANEIEKMLKFKNEDLAANGLPVQEEYYLWDSDYYDEMFLAKNYEVDHKIIAEYFPMDETVSNMLGFYENLFDIKFVEFKDAGDHLKWHSDIRIFDVYEGVSKGRESIEFLGTIYFDMHPREGKYGHAANFGLSPGYLMEDNVRKTPLTALICNFSKPTKEKPSLLNHDEVTTFFHELGHGVHDIVSRTRYARFHGTGVEIDFVEMPSQMLEFWTWSKNELRALSSHYETGEPISDALIEKLISTKHVNGGIYNLRQLMFGLFDMSLHTIDNAEDAKNFNLESVSNDLIKNVMMMSRDGNQLKFYNSFGHIAGGYESGYYGYLYSLVFSSDVYYSLFKDDPMNAANGVRYRDIILRRGGSRDTMENLIELLGREPNSKAFLSEIFG